MEPDQLPESYEVTRESLHALACYVISPARKGRTGRIGLRPAGEGFGTPPFEDGSRIVVRGDRLAWEPGEETPITTLRAAAGWLGVELSPDPGVGRDLPPFHPDDVLPVDPEGSIVLGRWYALGGAVLVELDQRLGQHDTMTEPQLWPEHFDLATEVALDGRTRATVGFSPGDGFSSEPYVYVGPFDRSGVTGNYWNAPFGAYRRRPTRGEAMEFIQDGLGRLRAATA